MSELKKIIYNCKQATFLIEKRQIISLTIRERIELRIHLAGCSVCTLFQKQSIVINRMVKDLIRSADHTTITLDEDYKKELQEQIDKEMDKN